MTEMPLEQLEAEIDAEIWHIRYRRAEAEVARLLSESSARARLATEWQLKNDALRAEVARLQAVVEVVRAHVDNPYCTRSENLVAALRQLDRDKAE